MKSDVYEQILDSKLYEAFLMAMELKKFQNKNEFLKYVLQIASDNWRKVESEKATIMKEEYEDTDINVPETEEELLAKYQEIKSRNAGEWEPYMVLKEMWGIDVVNSSDISTTDQEILSKLQRKPVDMRRGVFRRT